MSSASRPPTIAARTFVTHYFMLCRNLAHDCELHWAQFSDPCHELQDAP